MNIGVAQTRPVKGDIQRNVEGHKRLIDLAIARNADTLIFPELSLTGYEPGLASELATDPEDSRFDDFQKISDANQLTIGVGIPLKSGAGVLIGILVFQPHQPRQTYAKQHLHADEYPYFVRGQQAVFLGESTRKTALAICYELSVPEHAEQAYARGAAIYAASVAKTAAGVGKAATSLSDIASRYSMTVLMANCVGPCDHEEAGGKSAIWTDEGLLAGQLNDTDEGILLIDTDTQEVSLSYAL